jgi:phage baseplate assembly protein V
MMRAVAALIDQALHPVRMRVANLLARAIVQLVSDGTNVQTMQLGVLDGEDRDDCERIQQYGFSSVPKPGAEAVVLFVGGDRGHPLVIATDDRRYRPRGKPGGEVAIYSDETDEVRLARGNKVQVKSAGTIAMGADPVAVAENPLNGVATGTSIDSWGVPIQNVSPKVFSEGA